MISDLTTHESSFYPILPEFDILDDCCKHLKENISNENLHLIPLQPITLDSNGLNLASHKLNEINKNINNLYESTLFEKITNNNYVIYFICTIFKIFLVYLGYKLFRFCRSKYCRSNLTRHPHKSDCCQTINNCLTFNFSKPSKNTECLSLEDISVEKESTKDSESQSLRRSSKIAKLKDQI